MTTTFRSPREAASRSPAAAPEACPKCGSLEPWGLASWCPACGYYPAFGTCVDGEPEQGEVAAPDGAWLAVPYWGWILGAGVLSILALSAGARLLLPGEGPVRLLWAVTELVVGVLVFGVAHLTAYLFAAPTSDRLSPFDLFLKPIEVWKPTFAALPRGAQRVCLAAWGLTAVVCALAVVGGIRWSQMFDDWGFEKKAQPNLVQAIVKQAREERRGAESLEEAIGDFVGDAEEELPAAPSDETDCLIIGCRTSAEGALTELLLAAVRSGELRYVGTLAAETVPDEARARILRRIPELERETPLVEIRQEATWLQPMLMCRIVHDGWTEREELREPQFHETLADFTPE